MKKIITLSVCLFASSVFAANQGSQASTASMELSSQGISKTVSGSSDILVAGSSLPIVAVKIASDATYITLKAVGESTTTTIRVAGQLAASVTFIGGLRLFLPRLIH